LVAGIHKPRNAKRERKRREIRREGDLVSF